MPLFFATTVNKLDAKGRVSVPAGFRDAVAADPVKSIVLLKSPKLACLEGFTPSFMETMAARLDGFDLFSDAQDDFAMAVFSQAVSLAFDGEGRITLPQDLREHAGITTQVAFVGLGRKFQVWDPAQLAQRQKAAMQTFRDKGLTLPGGGQGGGGV